MFISIIDYFKEAPASPKAEEESQKDEKDLEQPVVKEDLKQEVT